MKNISTKIPFIINLMAFYHSTLLVTFTSIMMVVQGNAQYTGGPGKGEETTTAYSVGLSGINLQILFEGGMGQGYYVNSLFAVALNGSNANTPYVGSSGKGDAQSGLFSQSLAGDNLNVLFVGSPGRGDQFAIKTSYSLGGQPTDIIYFGSPGRGDTATLSLQNTLFDCSLQNMWNGKVSTAWEEVANWSCNQLPGVNSVVLIPSNVPRYPVVNLTTEIRSLKMDPGASVQVKAGQSLNLNGK
jgi:hypothetical protein